MIFDGADIITSIDDTTIDYSRGDTVITGVRAVCVYADPIVDMGRSIETECKLYVPRNMLRDLGEPKTNDVVIIEKIRWRVRDHRYLAPANVDVLLCVRDDRVRVVK